MPGVGDRDRTGTTVTADPPPGSVYRAEEEPRPPSLFDDDRGPHDLEHGPVPEEELTEDSEIGQEFTAALTACAPDGG